MYILREQDVQGDRIGPPYQRTIRHLVAPWIMGSQNLWVGTSSVDPGFTSNAHAHETQEEVFYCVSGRGRIRVDEEEAPLEPGKTYAIEMESIENYASLHGYVNIKNMVSDDKPGFNPYRKAAPDTYEKGTAYVAPR